MFIFCRLCLTLRCSLPEFKKDALLGGLLAPGFDEQSCASRYESVYYRKNMTRQPSPYLIKRLREHEALQRRCGPGTGPYARAIKRLRSEIQVLDSNDGCNYLVLISYRGLGNRILATNSAFLYALLTLRVLLVDPGQGNTLPMLFCEPFPGATWVLPPDFPVANFRVLDEAAPESYANVVVNRSRSVTGLRFVYAHLDHDSDQSSRLLYCDDHRKLLHRVQWMILRTDQYMSPGFFFNPAYEPELDRMFPRRDSVFYILSRYLLHPTNDVWGMITRFYDAYLKSADERLGIQIRVFGDENKSEQNVLDQILACTSKERLLPAVVHTGGGAPVPAAAPAGRPRSWAVLVTCLSSYYHDSIRGMYWKSATADGEVVSVHQASHEGKQHWFHGEHDQKALAEIYLLSLTDRIVTSGMSTFGYVSHALGGLAPHITIRTMDETIPDPACVRTTSMEPCAFSVQHFDCKKKDYTKDIPPRAPTIRTCEDVFWGVKLTDAVE
jgi:xyloglucan fucosyltransferase